MSTNYFKTDGALFFFNDSDAIGGSPRREVNKIDDEIKLVDAIKKYCGDEA